MRHARLRIVLAVGALALVAAGLAAGRAPEQVVWAIEGGLRAVRELGPAGWAVFALAQVLVALSGVLPASLLGIAAGVLYGVPAGFALAGIGTMAGAAAAFALSRSLFRPTIARMLHDRQRLKRLDGMVARDGWRFACLLRVSPVMPFAVTSYALGLSSITPRDYLLGTLAALPALLGYVVLGALAGSGLHAWMSGGVLQTWLLGFGAVATMALTLRVGQLVARALGRPALDESLQP